MAKIVLKGTIFFRVFSEVLKSDFITRRPENNHSTLLGLELGGKACNNYCNLSNYFSISRLCLFNRYLRKAIKFFFFTSVNCSKVYKKLSLSIEMTNGFSLSTSASSSLWRSSSYWISKWFSKWSSALSVPGLPGLSLFHKLVWSKAHDEMMTHSQTILSFLFFFFSDVC